VFPTNQVHCGVTELEWNILNIRANAFVTTWASQTVFYPRIFLMPRQYRAFGLRVSETAIPAFFVNAAAALGSTGTDAFLCNLGRYIATDLRSVLETAEAARAKSV